MYNFPLLLPHRKWKIFGNLIWLYAFRQPLGKENESAGILRKVRAQLVRTLCTPTLSVGGIDVQREQRNRSWQVMGSSKRHLQHTMHSTGSSLYWETSPWCEFNITLFCLPQESSRISRFPVSLRADVQQKFAICSYALTLLYSEKAVIYYAMLPHILVSSPELVPVSPLFHKLIFLAELWQSTAILLCRSIKSKRTKAAFLQSRWDQGRSGFIFEPFDVIYRIHSQDSRFYYAPWFYYGALSMIIPVKAFLASGWACLLRFLFRILHSIFIFAGECGMEAFHRRPSADRSHDPS